MFTNVFQLTVDKGAELMGISETVSRWFSKDIDTGKVKVLVKDKIGD